MIDPDRRRATAYRSLTDVAQVEADGRLDGGDVLPGFSCALGDILD